MKNLKKCLDQMILFSAELLILTLTHDLESSHRLTFKRRYLFDSLSLIKMIGSRYFSVNGTIIIHLSIS